MNIKNLITFKSILETGSFQKAATKLNYTQSTVTFQMKQLEQELSIQLFEKIGRKMELTQAGKDILPYVETILQAYAQINNYGRNLSEIKGSLRIVAPDSILIYSLQPFIQSFLHTAPHVQLVVNSLLSDNIIQTLVDDTADIGMTCERINYPATIIHKPLGPFKALLVASPLIDKNLLDFISPHQYKSLSMICNEPNSVYQREMTRYLLQKDITLNLDMKMHSIEAVKKCVMNNLGIAYIPVFAMEEELKTGSLIQIKTELDETIFNSVYMYNKNKWISPQLELALKLIEQKLHKKYI